MSFLSWAALKNKPIAFKNINDIDFIKHFSFDNLDDLSIQLVEMVEEDLKRAKKEKTLRERLFTQCFKQCFFPCKIGRSSIHIPRRRLFSIQPPVEREKLLI